ncbi:BnaA08g30390D [Brassica napus]|uniref:BnaA08g30390D protein n=3 Tax=Brassica TaxID=3705 RepID=A0A078IZG4_BRANA|nr:BnaA08g30390D [Brassica napus]
MGEATRMREKYPDRIPDTCSLIICFLNSNFDILLLGSKRDSEDDSDDDRYLVPSDLTVGQFKYVVRKRIKLGAEIAVFVNNTSMPPTAALMSAIYEKHKDERWATLHDISHHGCSIDTSRYVTNQSLNLNIHQETCTQSEYHSVSPKSLYVSGFNLPMSKLKTLKESTLENKRITNDLCLPPQSRKPISVEGTMASPVSLHYLINTFISKPQGFCSGTVSAPRPRSSFVRERQTSTVKPIKVASLETQPFPLFQSPASEESSLSELEPADPDFYKIGYVRRVRAYGVEFKEGPDGFGVYASKDIEPRRRARVIMEIPHELMITIRQKHPWMFFPDIVPIGHPIFDIINSTDPEKDWDLRLACLLLFSFDREDHFWRLYGDFLPAADECSSFLLATEEDLAELQDPDLVSTIRQQQKRVLEFWEKNWHSDVPLKIKRLAEDAERFIWAVSIAQTRCISMKTRVGALVQDLNMMIPYADMLNHSFEPNCFLHWRPKDRILEVMSNAGQAIKKGEEMTINYMPGQNNNMLMERYGFSTPVNPWDALPFSGDSRIHLNSFLSVFNIFGLPEDYYHDSELSGDDSFVDGAVIAAARTLPTWSDIDLPPIPSAERKAVKELQDECKKMLAEYPTTSEQDQKLLDSMLEARTTFATAVKYRMHRKMFIGKIIKALDIYQERLLF